MAISERIFKTVTWTEKLITKYMGNRNKIYPTIAYYCNGDLLWVIIYAYPKNKSYEISFSNHQLLRKVFPARFFSKKVK